MPGENPQKDDIAELQDQRVDNKELQDITKKVEDPDFCQNFADQLKTNEDGLVSAITSSVDKCNSDVQIQTLQNFLKSLEDIKGDIPHDFTALKIAIQTKIEEYEKTDENNISTQTFPNPDVLNDLQTQVDKIYQENGIEKEDAQKILDYISVNKDNPAFITFMDWLIKKNADGIKITFDKRDGYIWTAEDFAKKIEEIGLPKLDLKPKEKTVDNTNTGTTNTGTTNTASTSIDFATEVPKLKQEIEKWLIDGTAFLSFAKDSKTIQDKISSHPRYKEITADVANITDIKDLRNVMIKGAWLVTDVLKDADVKKDIETQLQKTPNNKITFDLIKQDHDYLVSVIQGLDKSIQNMTPQQFEEAIKNNTLWNASGAKDISTQDYNLMLSAEINDIKTSNQVLIKSGHELIKNLSSAKTQAEMNTIVDNFIKAWEANNDIKNDPNRAKLKWTLEKKQSIPKEDLTLIINALQNWDLDLITAKIEAKKKKTEAQEKLDKEQWQKELKSYLTAPLEGKSQSKDKNGELIDNITIVGEWLFENNKLAYDQLFDEKIRTELSPAEQKNLTKIIFAYLDQDFSENNSLNDLDFKTIKKWEKSSYPEGTNIITLKADPSVQIAFGSYDHVQELKTNIVPDTEITRFKDVLKNKPETIFLELANNGSYMLLKKILNSYTDQSEKISILNTLINKDVIGSIKDAAGKALPDSKDPNFENQKLLTKQSSVQQEGYINVIRDQVGWVLNTVTKLGEASPAVDLFQSYIKQCEKNPTYLGSDIQTRMDNHNNLVGIRKTLLDKDQNYTMKISTLTTDQLKGDPYALRDKNINTMIQNLYKGWLKEYNEKYGIKAQLEWLFWQFKDEIMMIAEFLGFDKEDALHRFGMNKSMQDAVNAAYEKAYKLDSGDKAVIAKMHEGENDYIKKITEVSAKIKDDKWEYTQDSNLIVSTFKENITGKYFLNTLKQSWANDTNVDRTFISWLLESYNKDKSATEQIKYTMWDNPDKVNPGWEDVIEKAWNDPSIRNTIKENSYLLEEMSKPQGKGEKMRDSKFTTAASYTVQELGANPMEAVSYYLSTMILAGSKDLKYKISENNAAEPVVAQTPDTPPKTTENKESLSKTLWINADFIDTTKTTDTKITLDKDANPVKINAIFTNFDNAPARLKIDEKYYSKKGDTYVDATDSSVKIKEGTTIESVEADKLAELIVNNTINTVSAIDKTNLKPEDYTTQVTKPIFDLFTTPNTYDYMHSHDKENQTITQSNTLNDLMSYSYKKLNPNSTTPFVKLDIATVVIKKKDESVDNKITFEVTEKGMTIPRVFTIDNTGKFEEIKKDKTPEKNTATIDYTNINTIRESLWYKKWIDKPPTDYYNKLMVEFVKNWATKEQKDLIVTEIARTQLQEASKLTYLSTAQTSEVIIDLKTIDPNTKINGLEPWIQIKKLDNTSIEITINNITPAFIVNAKIEEITKPVA